MSKKEEKYNTIFYYEIEYKSLRAQKIMESSILIVVKERKNTTKERKKERKKR